MLPTGVAYAQQRCALALVLAIDVSSSVDPGEYSLQMRGMANTLRDSEVIESIRLSGGIQLFAFEWSGRRQQVGILPWTYLSDRASVLAAASIIENHPRGHSDLPTSLGFALGYAAIQLQKAPQTCSRQVIDVSGDGVNNDGYEPRLAYRNFVFDGVQVNGLVIAGARPDPVPYFKSDVIFGPGAFVEVAADFADYERAMKRKLLREINGSALSLLNVE
ncbi:MAG: DUF1194 domain-containing protein [Pseudomonadota bacterium]